MTGKAPYHVGGKKRKTRKNKQNKRKALKKKAVKRYNMIINGDIKSGNYCNCDAFIFLLMLDL